MDKRATSSEGPAPESTAVVLSKTASSTVTVSEGSALDAPRPSSTRSEQEYSGDERLSLVLQIVGATLARNFVSSTVAWFVIRALQKHGFEGEAWDLAQGFTGNRSASVQSFMG